MATRRRTRAFWERLVSETADCSIVDTARRHRVKAGTLKWWKWQLGKDAKQAGSRRELAPKLLPVVLAAGNLAQHSVVLEVADVTMRIEIGSDPHYIAALASALRFDVLTLAAGVKVFFATAPVDLRRGHDGLCALVRGVLALDPFEGHLFVFVGRRGDRIKVLFWDRGGFVVYYKRLSKGRFRMPRVADDADRVVLDATELAMLLGGFDVGRVDRAKAWEPKSRRPAA